MARRLTALLLALAAMLAPLAAVEPAAAERAPRAGCCGASCQCDDACPCASSDDRGAPAGESPAAPATTRDARAFLVLLPSLVATLELELACESVAADRCGLGGAPAPSGRAILELVSRWTT